MARAYLIKAFETLGLAQFDTTYEQPFQYYNRKFKLKGKGTNLLGLIRGKRYPDSYMVVSAHYDHLGIRQDSVYNGADDNASGTCALLYLASYFLANPPNHSIIIAAFDAEEVGLQGAGHFVDEPPVPVDQLLLNINMDMIGRNVNNEIYICGTYHYPNLKKPLKRPARKSNLKVSFGHDDPNLEYGGDWTFASDHGPFHRTKIPFLYFGEEDHPDYHQPSDDFEGIMPEFYLQVLDLVRESIRQLDKKM